MAEATGKTGMTRPKQEERVFLIVVDESEEMPVALRYASRRAKATGGRVALFTTVEREDFGHWAAVDDLMEEELRQEAEAMMSRYAHSVSEMTGQPPVIYIRHGQPRDALLKLLEEEPTISILVLAAGTGARSPGPLITALTGKYRNRLSIPVTIVPGTLTDEDVDAVT